MQRHVTSRNAGLVLALVLLSGSALAPSASAQTPAAPAAGRAAGAPPAGDAVPRPDLLYKEVWKQPSYTGDLNDEKRRFTQEAVTNPNLELKVYGTDAKNVEVYNHEQRFDLWTGMVTSPVAIMLRHKTSLVDLTGLARLRAIVRSQSLHNVFPIVKLADGTLIAGGRPIYTDGEYLSTEIAFNNTKWFRVDPVKLTTGPEVKNPDLSRVDEVGIIDIAPGGGHGNAGWFNLSTVELFAKPVARGAGTR